MNAHAQTACGTRSAGRQVCLVGRRATPRRPHAHAQAGALASFPASPLDCALAAREQLRARRGLDGPAPPTGAAVSGSDGSSIPWRAGSARHAPPCAAPAPCAARTNSSGSPHARPQRRAAAATAALAVQCTTQQQQQQQQQAPAQAASNAAHVWLPDKQLWVPTTSAGAASMVGQAGSTSRGSGLAGGAASSPTLTRVFMASAASKGRKAAMEDRHVVAALHPDRGVVPCARARAAGQVPSSAAAASVAAVFDGHAGDATAAYAAQHIPRLLHAALSGQHSTSTDLSGPNIFNHQLLPPRSAFAAAFERFDRWWADARCDPAFTPHGWDDSGSTAVVALVSGQSLVVANAGDSIALLARGGSAQRLSEDHRLANSREAERVRAAGGRVVVMRPNAAPRVMGSSTQTRFKGSMVTRSLGDFAWKHPQPLLSAEPYVATHALAPQDKLVLLTSDGVSDVLPDSDLLGIGLRAIEEAQGSTNNGSALARAAASAVMDAAFAAGSRDNLTVVAMLLDWGHEYSDD